MNETALIMNNISDRSLILLDEIGRGTSTYDGISIAWSLAEYLHNNERAHPKTLFATHYHELNELAESHERVHNFHVSTKEVGQKVIFLRKLVPGGSNHSNGVAVDLKCKVNGSTVPNKFTNQVGWRASWQYQWLKENAASYQFKNYAAEAWHYDYRGPI